MVQASFAQSQAHLSISHRKSHSSYKLILSSYSAQNYFALLTRAKSYDWHLPYDYKTKRQRYAYDLRVYSHPMISMFAYLPIVQVPARATYVHTITDITPQPTPNALFLCAHARGTKQGHQ
jgi:hypothetical protein